MLEREKKLRDRDIDIALKSQRIQLGNISFSTMWVALGSTGITKF